MNTKTFNGELFEQRVTRRIHTVDPANPSRTIVQSKKYDMVTGLVCDKVTGYGESDTPNRELQITLSGQFAPFKNLRITASAQNFDKVVAALKGKVERSEGQQLPFSLKEDITFTAVGQLMKGRGMNVTELYITDSTGKVLETVIAAPKEPEGASNIGDALL